MHSQPTLPNGRYHAYVCNACGVSLAIPLDICNAGLACGICNQHYCEVCFRNHMMLGHSVDIGRKFDMFDFQEN